MATYRILRSFFRYNEVFVVKKTPSGGSKAKSSLELPREKQIAAAEGNDMREKFAICRGTSTGMRLQTW